jgi:hypothetical protein
MSPRKSGLSEEVAFMFDLVDRDLLVLASAVKKSKV